MKYWLYMWHLKYSVFILPYCYSVQKHLLTLILSPYEVRKISLIACFSNIFYPIAVLEAPVVPNSIDVEENYDVFITCDSSGSIPVISHTWRDTSGTIISTSEDLTLLDISTAQDGVYTCTIEDDMGGTASANTTINVLSMQ